MPRVFEKVTTFLRNVANFAWISLMSIILQVIAWLHRGIAWIVSALKWIEQNPDTWIKNCLDFGIGFFIFSLALVIFVYTFASWLSGAPISYLSLAAGILLFFIFIRSAYDNEVKGKLFRYAAIVLALVLTLQANYPLLYPKVSIDNTHVTFGEVTFDGNYHHYIRQDVELTVKPPLLHMPIIHQFPNSNNELLIPLAPSEIQEVSLYSIAPTLISRPTIHGNSLGFAVFGDGWTYDKINVKLSVKSDSVKQLGAYAQLAAFDVWEPKNVTKEGGTYLTSIIFHNFEEFPICFYDYEFEFPNGYQEELLKLDKSNYMLCESEVNSSSCYTLLVSNTNDTFLHYLPYNYLSEQSLSVKLGNFTRECIAANSSKTNSILIRALGYPR